MNLDADRYCNTYQVSRQRADVRLCERSTALAGMCKLLRLAGGLSNRHRMKITRTVEIKASSHDMYPALPMSQACCCEA